jgi:hypothetical protein
MNEFLYILIYVLQILLVLTILIFIIKLISKKSRLNHHSNWNTLLDDFEFSTKEFYELLKTELNNHGIKGITINYVSLKEGNILSSKRLYLRVTWNDYQYDICGAPFGKKGFFISWWLLFKIPFGQKMLSTIPFFGGALVRSFYPVTYYKIDTASMFMSYAQSSVLNVIDEITQNKGIRSLTERERKPILNDVFKR